MAARFVQVLLRKNTVINFYFSRQLTNKTRVFQLKATLPYLSVFKRREFSSNSPENEQNSGRNEKENLENEDKGQIKGTVGTVITQGPFGWLSKKLHMVLLKAFFDPGFNEEEFLRGAKQALIVTSEILAERRFQDMSKICPPKFVDLIQEALKSKDPGPAIRAVDIIMAKIKKIQLGFTEEQKKQVEIDVTFVCHPKDQD
ncbi:uncharacterized protein LOC116294297 [Actinia tenebrosa]|uniref:Uncharacterized protein LOC116294297 n=1 Tax=Actinia tenebrosa TaxID=6105 RepID=A0A6P8HMY1_ACTTE|nr:uncharacterized protein LOC116294297 [Actinia tenebrosa]